MEPIKSQEIEKQKILTQSTREPIIYSDIESDSEDEKSEKNENENIEYQAEEHTSEKRKKKKKKNRPKKKIINSYRTFLEHKNERKLSLHMIEKCFLANRWIQIYRNEGKTLVFRLLQQHFKEKDNDKYKSERNSTELPHDFSSSKGIPAKITKSNKKYYEKRYYLFSKFDEGIELDEESIFLM